MIASIAVTAIVRGYIKYRRDRTEYEAEKAIRNSPAMTHPLSGYQPQRGDIGGPPRAQSGIIASNPRRAGRNTPLDYLRSQQPSQPSPYEDEEDMSIPFRSVDLPRNQAELREGVSGEDHDGRRWQYIKGKKVYCDPPKTIQQVKRFDALIHGEGEDAEEVC